MPVKRVCVGCHFITSSLHVFKSSEMIYQLVLNCQFSDNVYLQLDHLEGFISCRTLHTKWHCFSFVTLLAEETLSTQNYWFSCFTNASEALNLTLSDQGQAFYICQWSQAVAEHFTEADSSFSLAFFAWSDLKFGPKVKRRIWETEF